MRPQKWLLLAAVLASFVSLVPAAVAQTQRGSVDVETEQCENRKPGPGINNCTGDAWTKGGLSAPHALYREGDFVPMRTVLENVQRDATYTVRIQYLAVFNHLHAYDYLGSYDATRYPGQLIVPCSNVANTAPPHACGPGPVPGTPSTRPVPEDTNTTFPNGGHPPPAEADAHFSAWGAELTGAEYTTAGCDTCGPIGASPPDKVHRQIDVTFRANGPTVVLAWGTHVASLLDWGNGRTIVSAGRTGNDFHLKVVHVQREGQAPEEAGGELSMSADVAPPAPGLSTQVSRTSATTDQTVTDTATLTGTAPNPVTGSVQFFVCGPAQSPDCSRNGTPLGPPQVVNTIGAGPDGEATITFPQEGAGPIAPGQYCFRAEFRPGTPHYSPAVHSGPTGPNECFVVTEPPPLLTVTKICDPLNDPGFFNLELITNGVRSTIPDGTDVPCTDPPQNRGPFETTVGDHTVTESAGTDTNLADYAPPAFGGDCLANGSITLGPGESKACTITNVRLGQPVGHLTVEKICRTAGDTGRFEIRLDGTRVAELECGETTDPIALAPGNYTVSEAAGEDTSLADYETPVIGGDCSSTGSVTIVATETAACTITNTRIPPKTTLEVKKFCDPTGDNGHFTIGIFTLAGGLVHRVVVACGGTTGAVTVSPGTYVIRERGANGTHVTEYDRYIAGDCDPTNARVTLEAGDEKVCTITNVRRNIEPKPALLTVTKVCVPSDDGGRFNLTIEAQTAHDATCGYSFGPVALAPGQHQVSESAGTGTNASDYTTTIGGDCGSDGTITLAAGQPATCTVTNVRRGGPEPPPAQTGTVEVLKQCSPSGTQRHFLVEIDQRVFRLACGQSTGPVEIGVGDHRVGEVSLAGITASFMTTVGGDCAASGSFTLLAGQHVVCTVTNTAATIEPPLKPPPVCYTLTVRPRMARVGRVRVLARVHVGRHPVEGIRVYARGLGVSTFRTTNRRGRAVFALTLLRRGILRVTIRQQFQCPKPPPRDVGIIGAATPPVTG